MELLDLSPDVNSLALQMRIFSGKQNAKNCVKDDQPVGQRPGKEMEHFILVDFFHKIPVPLHPILAWVALNVNVTIFLSPKCMYPSDHSGTKRSI